MKSFKEFILEGEVVQFPGPKQKKPIPQFKEPELSIDDIKSHAQSVGHKVFSIIKNSGRQFETPTLTSAYGTDKRAHPDFYTQLNDHIFGEGGNKEFAIQHYKNNKEAIHSAIDETLGKLKSERENDLTKTTGKTHEALIKREHDIPAFQLERIRDKLSGL